MQKVIVASADGHASMPPALWPDYLEKKYHHFLPQFYEETALNSRVLTYLNDMRLTPEACEIYDTDHLYRSGQWQGLWDRTIRVEQLDREGVAAEIVYPGDFRASDLGFNVLNRKYPLEVIDAGVRAFDRWAFDEFGGANDRLLLVGAIGPCTEMDETVAELNWISEHGFVGVFCPGFTHYPGRPALFDPHWEPFWAACAERGLAVVVHAGYGQEHGYVWGELEGTHNRVRAAGGSDLDLVIALTNGIFNADFFSDIKGRRPFWQIAFAGVFDRHPSLKLMLTEIRADWLPATLSRLDRVFEKNRTELRATRLPSDYWQSNCLAGLSFMHKCEVDMRFEIGIDNIAFGRDYPHTESSWPNTGDYLRAIFSGLPEAEVRLMVGENLVRFLGLDRSKLATVAERVGPSIGEMTAEADNVSPELMQHLDDRCGIAKPAEGDSRIQEIQLMLDDDLSAMRLAAQSA